MTPERFTESLKDILAIVTVTYCGMREADIPRLVTTYKECERIFEGSYMSLSPSEIKLAFEKAAKKEIQADITAYYGAFTVAIFVNVMQAYTQHRAKVQKAIEDEISKQDFEAKELQRKQSDIDRLKQVKNELIACQVENRKYKGWRDLPAWLCRSVIDEGLIKVEHDVKKSLWEQSMSIMQADAKADFDLEENSIAKVVKGKEIEAILSDNLTENLKARRENIYARLLVFHTFKTFKN